MNLLAFLLVHVVRRGAWGLTVVNSRPGACRGFISLRQGVAILCWLCLPSTLADAISSCYGEKPCFVLSECLWRVGKERAVCA